MLRFIAIFVVLGAIAGLLMFGSKGGDPPPEEPGTLTVFTSSAQCQECHPGVYAEWKKSYHGLSFQDPLVRAENMSDNFKKKDCIPCHAPRPVFEHGIGLDARVVPRSANRHEGVDCLACHKMAEGVAASRDGLSGACNPIFEPRLKSVEPCAPCHDQHKTISGEWAATEAFKAGIGCNDCHMPVVDRPAFSIAGKIDVPARKGRSHRFPGAHDVPLLKSALKVTHRHDKQNGDFVVTLLNDGAAHHVPTDARHRAMDLVVTLFDADGSAIAPQEERDFGQENGTHRLRLRNPYRTEAGKKDKKKFVDKAARDKIRYNNQMERYRSLMAQPQAKKGPAKKGKRGKKAPAKKGVRRKASPNRRKAKV